MKGLKDEKAGVLTARREPIDIGIPSAVVFLIRNGMGFVFLSRPSSSTSLAVSGSSSGAECSSILNRFGTTTFGARDLVVIVLKQNNFIVILIVTH